MKFAESFAYPSAGVEAVFSLVSDQQFRSEACEKQHALSHSVDVTVDGEVTVIRIERTLPAEMPDFIKRLTGDTVSAVQIEKWHPADASGNRYADVSVDIVGQPATMKGEARLTSTGDGTQFDVTGDVKVAIPLVGRKIEPEVAKAISKSLHAEVEYGITKL